MLEAPDNVESPLALPPTRINISYNMASNLAILVASVLSVYCYMQFRALRHNIEKAKQSGFPYVVAP